jgi:hypothetical protein
METVCSSEMLANGRNTTWHTPEHYHLYEVIIMLLTSSAHVFQLNKILPDFKNHGDLLLCSQWPVIGPLPKPVHGLFLEINFDSVFPGMYTFPKWLFLWSFQNWFQYVFLISSMRVTFTARLKVSDLMTLTTFYTHKPHLSLTFIKHEFSQGSTLNSFSAAKELLPTRFP